MKNSGVDFLGCIPNDWDVVRVKEKYSFFTGFTPDTNNSNYYDDTETGLEWLTISDLTDKKEISNSTKSKISKLYVSKYHPKIALKGSLLYTFKLSVGQVNFVNRNIYTNEAIAVFEPNEDVNLNYLYYSSRLIELNANFNIYGAKILNSKLIKNAVLPFPPLNTQNKIANYLDYKICEIDSLIDVQLEQIGKLNEYKNSLIENTVLHGLDENVKLRDSGIDWIGRIPCDWKVKRIKNLFDLSNEKTLEKDLNKVNLISLYTDKGVVQHSDLEQTSGNKAVSSEGYKIVRKEDIVVNIILCWMGAIGRSNFDGVTSPAYDVYHPRKNVCSRYYHYLFRIDSFSGECFRYGRGIMLMRWRTYSTEFLSLSVPYPSILEQEKIANYLDEKCLEIDSIIKIKNEKIKLLKEYKETLIYEYVTGKKEVIA